jgi:uridine monophosphate synthetase
MNFWSKLRKSIETRNSLLCVGLDPYPERIPASYATVGDFNKAIIDATADVACIYKPNIAFYEALGPEGLTALRETLDYIPDEIPVLLDAKRGDIATTGAAYAKAVFGVWGADAVTVNPYLGQDGVAPFLFYEDRGVFVLCKTSNDSAGEVQDWSDAGEPLYERVAHLTETWAGGREIGLVVGATYPEALAEIRLRAPGAWFLVPGVGAQGGDLAAVLVAGLWEDGQGLIINSSRGILYAPSPREAALALRDRINGAREAARVAVHQVARDVRVEHLAKLLFKAGCVQFGDFTLRSGAHSPIYIDLRRLVTYPRLMAEVARDYARLLGPLTYDRIAAIPYAALPIGMAVAMEVDKPLIYPRREAKSYGTKRQIEGTFNAGERVVLLDDLITRGGSKLDAMEPLLEAGLEVKDVVVLIDREQGGGPELAAQGIRLHAAVTLGELVDALVTGGQLTSADAQRVHDYLEEGT